MDMIYIFPPGHADKVKKKKMRQDPKCILLTGHHRLGVGGETFNWVYYSWESVAVTSDFQCRTRVSMWGKFIWNKSVSACLRVCESKFATAINIYAEIIILLQTVPAGNEYLKFQPHTRQRVKANAPLWSSAYWQMCLRFHFGNIEWNLLVK